MPHKNNVATIDIERSLIFNPLIFLPEEQVDDPLYSLISHFSQGILWFDCRPSPLNVPTGQRMALHPKFPTLPPFHSFIVHKLSATLVNRLSLR
jgi:hypothetical protein